MNHPCHAHGCEREIPPRMFMCGPHWFSLRPIVRAAIWREYRAGQEDDKSASARYLAVQQRAIAEQTFKPNDEEAVRRALPYLARSERYRQLAIDAGDGDPLVGLGPTPIAPKLTAPR